MWSIAKRRFAASIPVNPRYWRERKEEPGKLTYVALGDSAAQGIGASRPQHSYVGFVAEHITAAPGRTVGVANLVLREDAAARNFTLVPLYTATKRQGARGIPTQFAGDLFHPNDRGYRVWSAAFTAAVDARLASLAG